MFQTGELVFKVVFKPVQVLYPMIGVAFFHSSETQLLFSMDQQRLLDGELECH